MNIKGPDDWSEIAINEHQLAVYQRPPPSIPLAKERWSGTRSWCSPRHSRPNSTAEANTDLSPKHLPPSERSKLLVSKPISLTASLPASVHLPFPTVATFLGRDSTERVLLVTKTREATKVMSTTTQTQHLRYHTPTPLASLSSALQTFQVHVKMRNYNGSTVLSPREPRTHPGSGWRGSGEKWERVGCSEEQEGKQ